MNLDKFKKWDKVPKNKKAELKKDIFDMVKLQIDSYTREQRSPVTGGKFKKLSESYAKLKKKMVGNDKPDLHLRDKMIKSIRADFLADRIRFKITAESQIAKSYNHLTGDTVPKRQFLPDDEVTRGRGAGFHKDIKDIVQDMINDAAES